MGSIYSIREWRDKDYEKIADMYRKGETMTKIAKSFGVHKSTIRRRLQELGLVL